MGEWEPLISRPHSKIDKHMSMQDHLKLLRTCKSAVDNLSASTMSDETWQGIIIQSIPPTMKWLAVVPSLYAMSSSSDITSQLLAHAMFLERGNESNKHTSGSSNTVLVAKTSEGCTNPNCKARKRSTHTTANCYWPGGGKEGQFPSNFGQRTKANVASSNPLKLLTILYSLHRILYETMRLRAR
jgi:hypothetical protein